MATHSPLRSGSVPAHAPTPADLERLATYPHLVVIWIGDDGYPVSAATTFESDPVAGTVSLAAPAMAVPTDREVGLLGSHIHPTPGGYDERRYLQVWGRASDTRDEADARSSRPEVRCRATTLRHRAHGPAVST